MKTRQTAKQTIQCKHGIAENNDHFHPFSEYLKTKCFSQNGVAGGFATQAVARCSSGERRGEALELCRAACFCFDK